MKNVRISVEVTYRATVYIDVPDDMYEKLEEAEGRVLDAYEDSDDMAAVQELLSDKIHEADAYDWEIEVESVSEYQEEK